MTTTPFISTKGLRSNRETAPGFWMVDILWFVLVDGNDTNGAYSVMEQFMRRGSGAFVPHIHSVDEWFYVFEGEINMTAGEENFTAKGGDSIWIPRGTVHHFKVESEVCHVLNGYTPAGFEQVLMGLAQPAERRELPPPDFPKPDQATVDKIFNNYWTVQADASWAHSQLGMQPGIR